MRLRVCLCLVLLGAVSGQEVVVRDVRLGLASRPVGFDYALSSPTAERSGSDAFDAGLGLEGGARWSLIRSGDRVGLLLGGDLRLDGYSYGSDSQMASQGLRLCAGAVVAINDRWTTALEFGWSYSRSQLSIAGNSSLPALDADGTASGWDIRLTAERMLTRRFGLGAVLGWEAATHDLSAGQTDLTFDQSGWFIGFELRWRFHDRPPLLD